MAAYPHLSRAPVVEAVVDLRARMLRPAAPVGFAEFRDRLQGQYPRAKDIRFLEAHLNVDGLENVQQNVSNTLFGVRLEDTDGRWVIQAKGDGLAVSRLPPYESWEGLRDTVRSIWPIYVGIFGPESVLRLGVRYINRLPMQPEQSVDLDLMLTAGPRIPPKLPQTLAQFVTRVVIPVQPEGVQVAILQSIESSPTGGGLILDIDAWCEKSVTPDSEEIWATLEALREAKNMAFFGSLTQPAWEQFL